MICFYIVSGDLWGQNVLTYPDILVNDKRINDEDNELSWALKCEELRNKHFWFPIFIIITHFVYF